MALQEERVDENLMASLTCIELCAGAGGQALGLEAAGFEHLALVDLDEHCCATLRYNRPGWKVIRGDITEMTDARWAPRKVDLLAAGLPCPPFSIAGKQLGQSDERDLFPAALKIAEKIRPNAIMIENVKGFLYPVFASYWAQIKGLLESLDYTVDIKLLQASNFGVPQLRPRVIIAALKKGFAREFRIPVTNGQVPASVGDVLYDLMSAEGWRADAWRSQARGIAPTIVGGSKKHGGPDLGPTRARAAWKALGVDGGTLAESAPAPGFLGMPRLTVRMVARLQGFPDDWHFTGGKTAAYRQVGNAFPPPVAAAVATQIARRLGGRAEADISDLPLDLAV